MVTDLRARSTAMVDQVAALVAVESPSDDVAGCRRAADVASMLAAQVLPAPGRVVDSGGRPSLAWGPPQPRVLLLGHLDTVWPHGTLARLPWRVDGDVMRGPGVFDMKAGVVVALQALAAVLEHAGADAPVGLLLTTDEEIESRASRHLIEGTARGCRAVLVCEPSAEGSLKSARKGTSRYTAAVAGRAAHAGLDPDRGVNALLAMARLAEAVAATAAPDRGTTVTPTQASAGTTSNTVPARAELGIDVRAWEPEEQRRVDRALRALTAGAGHGDPHGAATVTWSGGIDRLAMPACEELLARVGPLCRSLGIPDPGARAVGGASDGNLTAALGVPTLDGLGAVGGGAHADDEWASVSALPERAALVAALTLDLLTLDLLTPAPRSP